MGSMMLSTFSYSSAILAGILPSPIFATPSMNVCVAIVLFMSILGLLVTLSPARRTSEVKKIKDDSL
jgi:hypothetical protein